MPRAPGYAADLASAAALTAALMLTLPYAHIAAAYRGDTDSRLRFAAWARAHMKAGSELLIPQALPFSPETLPHGLSVQSVDLASAEQTASVVRAGRYMLLPHWTSDEGVAERVAHLAPGLAVLPHHRVVREFPGLPAEPGIEQELSINPAFQLVRF
jgi:hypothetical protein